MGAENSEKKSVIVMLDGKLAEISLETIHRELGSGYTAVFGLGEKRHFTVVETVKMKRPKRLRCKNRKRFIKLLMASGLNRNAAKSTANYIAWTNQKGMPARFEMSYQQYYTELLDCGVIRL